MMNVLTIAIITLPQLTLKFFSTMMSATMTFNFSGQGKKKNKKAKTLRFLQFKRCWSNAGKNTEFIFIELLITCVRKIHILELSEQRVLTNQSELCFCFQPIRCAFFKW